jgi:hypothetical protein
LHHQTFAERRAEKDALHKTKFVDSGDQIQVWQMAEVRFRPGWQIAEVKFRSY